MQINRETAMRLWGKTFGKETSVLDYAGRKIVKGAYNDRNSDFGWNVDHICPQSRGGATNDSNLIVCHILTNDEKADKFPCFTANKNKFQIVKVQNHYEIKNLSNIKETQRNEDTNFLDSASGIRLLKKLKGIQNKPRFVGSVFVKLENVENTALIDFIEKLFDEENISFSEKENSCITTILLKNYDMTLKEDTSEMLNKCVVLNTYLGGYFKEKDIISNYEIIFRVDNFKGKKEMYLNDQIINNRILLPWVCEVSSYLSNTLLINDLVVDNAETKKIEPHDNEYYRCDSIYSILKDNLIKEASRR